MHRHLVAVAAIVAVVVAADAAAAAVVELLAEVASCRRWCTCVSWAAAWQRRRQVTLATLWPALARTSTRMTRWRRRKTSALWTASCVRQLDVVVVAAAAGAGAQWNCRASLKRRTRH